MVGRLFYPYKTEGDTLFLLFHSASYPAKVENRGDVTSLYKENNLIGINIAHFGEIVKIKANGYIVTPDDRLIDVINIKLRQAGLDPIPYIRDSGFKVAKITFVKEHPLNEKKRIVHLYTPEKIYDTVTSYLNIKVDDLVIILVPGGMRFDGTIFQESKANNLTVAAEICSSSDLHIGEEKETAFILEEGKVGEDFFLG